MTFRTDARLTPRQRLGRGLAHTAAGPVDIARGSLGLSAQSLCATASGIRRQYAKSQLRRELKAAQDVMARELAAAQDVVTSLPEVIADARKPKRSRRLLIVVSGVAVLGLGAITFSILRRSRQPEPSPLPPSVQVDPAP